MGTDPVGSAKSQQDPFRLYYSEKPVPSGVNITGVGIHLFKADAHKVNAVPFSDLPNLQT